MSVPPASPPPPPAPSLEFLNWGLPRQDRLPPPPPRWRLTGLLLLLTAVTTTIVGMRLQFNFLQGLPAYRTNDDLMPFAWAWHHLTLLPEGLPFAAAVMAILLAHELGHYCACRYYRLNATLPVFLPAPTLIGTMGAVIRIRSPFNDRRELFDIGIAGPLAGFALTLPLLWWGLAHSTVLDGAQVELWRQQAVEFGWPPLGRLLLGWMHPGLGTHQIGLSPVARAGWVGMLVTMLNLLPAAQLDGGHILFAFSPRLHRITSWALMLGLLAAGWFYWPGWYVWAAFIALMRARHPFVPNLAPVGRTRAALAILALAIFLLTFAAVPFITP